ncbi:hypothetical protein GEMRC1_005869 [Eukaryota sp. GEM-RC1]
MLLHCENKQVLYKDGYVLFKYPNNIYALTLSPEDPILNNTITNIQIERSLSISGKKKSGSIRVAPDTKLITITTPDGEHIIRCHLTGVLIQVNERLVQEPELLYNPLSTFIAVFYNVSS